MQINKTNNTSFNGKAFIYDGGNMLNLIQKLKLKKLARLLPTEDVVVIGTKEYKTHDVYTEKVYKLRAIRVNTKNNNYGMNEDDFEQILKELKPKYDQLSKNEQRKLFNKAVYHYLKSLLSIDIPAETRPEPSLLKFAEEEMIENLKSKMKRFSKKKKTYSHFDWSLKPIKDFYNNLKKAMQKTSHKDKLNSEQVTASSTNYYYPSICESRGIRYHLLEQTGLLDVFEIHDLPS